MIGRIYSQLENTDGDSS